MAGYLDEYGVKDAQRAKLTKQIVIGLVIAIVLGTAGFFYFRNLSEERAMIQFISLLEQKNYQEAYKLWQTPDSEKFYPMTKFMEDWGPKGVYSQTSAMKNVTVDACDAGVVFEMSYPNSEEFGLWVERKTNVISFAPWPRCPGRHLQIMEYLRAQFGGRK